MLANLRVIACVLAMLALAAPASAALPAGEYPNRSIRLVVPFQQLDASGLVSRRPARGKDAHAPGFAAVAMVSSQEYPTKPIRLIVPFAPGGRTHILRGRHRYFHVEPTCSSYRGSGWPDGGSGSG